MAFKSRLLWTVFAVCSRSSSSPSSSHCPRRAHQAGRRTNPPRSGGAGRCALNTGEPPAAASFSVVRSGSSTQGKLIAWGLIQKQPKAAHGPSARASPVFLPVCCIFCPWCQNHGLPCRQGHLEWTGELSRCPLLPPIGHSPGVLEKGGEALMCVHEAPVPPSGLRAGSQNQIFLFFFFFLFSQSVSLAIVLIKQSPFIRGSLTHFISLLFCFEISRATINFREREREREFNKDLLLLSASIAVMKIYFLSLLCPI